MAITIDGTTYAIEFVSCKRKAEFLDLYAERSSDGILRRQLLGVYYRYELVLASSLNTPQYATFWQKLTEPTEFHEVVLPDETGDAALTFTAYFASVSDELIRVKDGHTYFKGLTVHFISQAPNRTPA